MISYPQGKQNTLEDKVMDFWGKTVLGEVDDHKCLVLHVIFWEINFQDKKLLCLLALITHWRQKNSGLTWVWIELQNVHLPFS